MTATVRTCLWFEADAERAVGLYVSLLQDSRVDGVVRPAPDAPALLIHFTLAGVPYTALQAGPGPVHSAAASIAVVLDRQEAADALYDRLIAAGGSPVECGWLTDPWGISWQIIPDGTHQALFGGDAEANQRAYAALRRMKKIDAAVLARAAAGEEAGEGAGEGAAPTG